ncbi:MAG: PhoX family protein, partial [Wohlfahrtiimonas sp.]
MGRPKAVYLKNDKGENISNETDNPIFSEILEKPLSRRTMLSTAGMGAGLLGLFSLPLANIAKAVAPANAAKPLNKDELIRFKAVPFSTKDDIVVPEGYEAKVFYRWGDNVGINNNMPEFKLDASNTADEQAAQAGMHHDGMAYFPINNTTKSTNGLLVMNHEYVDNGLLFPDGDNNWSLEKVHKSQNAMGISVIEVQKDGNEWKVVRPSKFARRITPYTEMVIEGP